MDFHLGGTHEEGESKVLLPLRRESSNKDCHTRELRESPRGSYLKKRQPRERIVRGKENKKERVKCCCLWKR